MSPTLDFTPDPDHTDLAVPRVPPPNFAEGETEEDRAAELEATLHGYLETFGLIDELEAD